MLPGRFDEGLDPREHVGRVEPMVADVALHAPQQVKVQAAQHEHGQAVERPQGRVQRAHSFDNQQPGLRGHEHLPPVLPTLKFPGGRLHRLVPLQLLQVLAQQRDVERCRVAVAVAVDLRAPPLPPTRTLAEVVAHADHARPAEH